MKKFALLFIVISLAGFGGYSAFDLAYNKSTTWVMDRYHELRSKLTTVEYIQVEKEEEDTQELIERISRKHEINPLITKALIVQESGTNMRPDRLRHEPHLLKRFRRETYMTDIEYEMLATSVGLTQVVYGLHKDTCKLTSYTDLLDREKNLECGLTVLKSCLAYNKTERVPSMRLRKALGCYNGDGTGGYADSVMSTLANLVVNQL